MLLSETSTSEQKWVAGNTAQSHSTNRIGLPPLEQVSESLISRYKEAHIKAKRRQSYKKIAAKLTLSTLFVYYCFLPLMKWQTYKILQYETQILKFQETKDLGSNNKIGYYQVNLENNMRITTPIKNASDFLLNAMVNTGIIDLEKMVRPLNKIKNIDRQNNTGIKTTQKPLINFSPH